MHDTKKQPESERLRPGQDDIREALYDGRPTGMAAEVQKPVDLLTNLCGILFDLDPKLLKRNGPAGEIPEEPHAFYRQAATRWLAADPVLAKAEVRCSGTGLHALLNFDKPVEFENSQERDKWAAIVNVVQAALPIDPNQPGIIALTRPVGAMNTKSGTMVEQLAAGQLVTAAEVLALFDRMRDQPFETVAEILFGTVRISPCPICCNRERVMGARQRAGYCYECGKIKLDRLYDAIFVAQTKPGSQT